MQIQRLPELDAEVARIAALHRIPGFAVGVIRGDDNYVATAGVTSTTDPLPVTAETLFHIGSTSKTLTATALMAATEAGLLTLGDLVASHLPDLTMADPGLLDVLTVSMLLNHTAGFRGDASADTGWGDDAIARSVPESISQQPQLIPPGRLMSYSNAAVGLAGRLLEVVTGEVYEAAVRRLVLEPLGMASTCFLPWEAAHRRSAVGHSIDPVTGTATPLPGWPLYRSSGPYGGAVSSVTDQLRYARFHLDGGPVLSDAGRTAMQRPTVTVRSAIDGVGVGWLLKSQRGTRLVTHGGNVDNLYLSSFALAPELGVAVTTLSNCSAGAAAGEAMLDWVLDLIGLPAAEPLPALPVNHEFVGRYDAGQWFQDVTCVEGKLFVAMVLPESSQTSPEIKVLFDRPPTELVVVGDDLVAPADRPGAASGDFVRREDGSIGWLRYGLRLAAKVR